MMKTLHAFLANRFNVWITEGYGGTELNSSAIHINFSGDRFANGYATALKRLTKAFALVRFDVGTQKPTQNPGTGFLQECKPGEVGLHISRINERYPFVGYADEQATKKKVRVYACVCVCVCVYVCLCVCVSEKDER